MTFKNGYPECYANFITLKQACNGVPSTSGLYIEQLEGINLKRAANVASTAYQTAVDLIHDKVISAIQLAESKVQGYLIKAGHNVALTHKAREFGSLSSIDTELAAPTKRGIAVQVQPVPFVLFYVESLYIRSQTTQASTLVEFIDEFGVPFHSLTVDLQGNVLSIVNVGLYIERPNFRIVIDNTNLVMASCKVDSAYSCCDSDIKKRTTRGYSVRGWNGSDYVAECYGIGLRGGLTCSVQKLMCQLLPNIKQSILYMAGVEILKEFLASDRLNMTTIHSKEWASEKIPEWQEMATELLETALAAIIPNLLKNNQFCFPCNNINKPRILSTV